jgi:hypothetical protein
MGDALPPPHRHKFAARVAAPVMKRLPESS